MKVFSLRLLLPVDADEFNLDALAGDLELGLPRIIPTARPDE
jgi:hypothetical protein